jgi:vacuolar-type H+-ATPase subunit E/Vma4
MALDDLLRAIEVDAEAERLRADREKAAAATAIVDGARREAAALEAALTSAPEAESLAVAERVRALARLRAADTIRGAREEAYVSVLDKVREELTAVRGSSAYPAVFRALLDESRAALPDAHELRVDRRDADLAVSVAGDLKVVAVLDTWGGVELTGNDGRTVRNTLEERLANADLLLRSRFAQWSDSRAGAASGEVP